MIETNDLRRAFNELEAVAGINFTAQRGEIFGLLGPNGVVIIYILAGIFVGPLGELLSSNPITRLARFLPTYYIAEGVSNASQNLGTLGSNLLDIGVILGSTLALLARSVWALRRQSADLASV